jgi:type I restriction enzyme M protein
MLTGQLRNEVDRLWETFWTGGITNPLTVIEQITYLLFLKRMDQQQTLKERSAHMLETDIKDPIYTETTQALRWSRFSEKDPEVMFELFTQGVMVGDERITVFEHMKRMAPEDTPFARFMKGATFMISTPRLLDRAIQLIGQINMDDRDTKGDLYEYLLSKLSTAGQNGQFRTPRHIIQMMVDMMQPQPDDTICDPSAGTCGFLVASEEFLRKHHGEEMLREAVRQHYNSDLFTGMEFDSSMLRIGAMNMMLHGIEHPQLIDVDALSQKNADIRDAFSLILANPPFKGSLDYDYVDPDLLKITKTKKTELLFLALMLRMLRTGGRAAVIVPDGVLFGSSRAHKALRETLVEDHRLQAVISMPSGVFKPYAGVSTAVVIFTKTNSGGTDHVWFYDMQADGYSLDDKRTPLGRDLTEKPDSLADDEHLHALKNPHGEIVSYRLEKHSENNIPDLLQRWHNLGEQPGASSEADRPRTAPSFLVPKAELADNDYDLSINRYKEIVYEATEYDPPATILGRIRSLDQERAALMDELEKMLKE